MNREDLNVGMEVTCSIYDAFGDAIVFKITAIGEKQVLLKGEEKEFNVYIENLIPAPKPKKKLYLYAYFTSNRWWQTTNYFKEDAKFINGTHIIKRLDYTMIEVEE